MPTFYAPINLNKQELWNPVLHVLPSDPSGVEGQLYYNSTTKIPRFHNGTAFTDWVGTAADASTTVKGIAKMSVAPASGANPIAVGDNDPRVVDGQAAGTASIRQLGTGSTQAFPGNGRHDQIAAPTAATTWGGQKITNLADPTAAQDAATKNYVDTIAAGLDGKASVRVATTAAGTLASSFANGQTVDGITLATGDRILIKNQAAPAENGVYVVAASGAPARASDFDLWAEIPGAMLAVEVGTANADTVWLSSADQGGTLGTTAVTFTRLFNNPADLSNVTGTLAVGNGGTGQTTAKAARETGLAAAGYYSSATHALGSTITITQATHGLRASRGLVVQVQLEADGTVVYPDVAVAANGDVTVTFGAPQAANTMRVTIIG